LLSFHTPYSFTFRILPSKILETVYLNSIKERQIQATKDISQHIGSDLRLVMSLLQGLADSVYLQQGELSGDKTNKLMQEKYSQANTLTTVDGLFIADKDDIITSNIVSKGQRSFINIDISFRDYVRDQNYSNSNIFQWV